MSVCADVQTNVGQAAGHDRTPQRGKSWSYWLYGGFQSLAAELVPCCPQVRTLCPWAALPRFLRPGWPPLAACAGSAGHKHTPKLRLCIKPLPTVCLLCQWESYRYPTDKHVCLKRKKYIYFLIIIAWNKYDVLFHSIFSPIYFILNVWHTIKYVIVYFGTESELMLIN